MKIGYRLLSILICAIFFSATTLPVLGNSKQVENEATLLEEEGTYDVPGHPKLKVKIFVYHPKFAKGNNRKPKPSPTTPDLVCGLEDPDSTAVVDPAGWHLPNGQWIYNLNTASVPRFVGSSNLSIISSNSFNTWAQTSV